jgi:hypothetical protein
MATPNDLRRALSRPGVHIPAVEFDMIVAFIQGFDLASNGGALAGFREWLIVKLGVGNNLAWSGLVLRSAFPDSDAPRKCLLQENGHKQAIAQLIELLDSFWQLTESPDGLRRIYLRYEAWLKTQEWYGPSSPQWIEEQDPGAQK